MKRFLWKCMHNWLIYERHVMQRTHATNPNLSQEYLLFVLKCEHCGDIKERIVG